MPDATLDRRRLLLTRWGELKNERATLWPHWHEISRLRLPRSGMFFLDDKDQNSRAKWNSIKDSTGTRALRIAGAGLQSGMTSPARPWFRIATADEDLMKRSAAVRVWLADVGQILRNVFARSNTYRSLHTVYEELLAYGTACDLVVDDFDTVIHHHPMTAGEYALATNAKGAVDTMAREFQLTVSQMVKQFGIERLSTTTKNLYDRGTLGAYVPVIQIVEPRVDRDASKRDAANKRYASVYIESGSREDRFLRDSGFDDFPVLAPRWAVNSGDVYGTSPAMESLGDILQLQHAQLRKGQVIDYKTKPPLQVPTALKNGDFLPGGVSFVDNVGPGSGVRSAFEVNLTIQELLEDIQDVRQRINSAFYADVFAMLLNDDRSGTTAREIAERHEEKLILLGPVLERLDNELLMPQIDLTFARAVRAGMLPRPPEELQGHELNIQFSSVLHQAQRAVGVTAVDRLLGTVAAIANFKPEVVDKIDGDKVVDRYSDMLGSDPDLLVADEKLAIIRQSRAQAQQQAAAAAQAESASATAKNIAAIPPDTAETLTDNIRALQGYTGASA